MTQLGFFASCFKLPESTPNMGPQRSVFWVIPSLICMVCWTLGGTPVLGQQYTTTTLNHEPRTWTDLSGKFSVDARFVSATTSDVTIEKPDGTSVTVKRSRLSKGDQSYIAAAITVSITEEQDAKIAPELQRFLETPQQGVAQIEAVDEALPGGMIAPLLCATSYATHGGKPAYNTATRYMDRTLLLARGVQQEFPDAYGKLYASALNNKAILLLRDKKAAQAAKLFSELATGNEAMSEVSIHNVQLLLAIVQEAGGFELAASQRKLLTMLLTKANATASSLPTRFVYTTEYESQQAPRLNLAGDDLARYRFDSKWIELTCFTCSGVGIIDCGACANGVVSRMQNEPVAVVPLTNDIIYRPKVYSAACANCKGKGKFDCPHCDNGMLFLR